MRAIIDTSTGQPYLHPAAIVAEMRRAGLSHDAAQEIVARLLKRAYDEEDSDASA